MNIDIKLQQCTTPFKDYLLNPDHPQMDKVLEILSRLKDSRMVLEQLDKKEQEHGSC